MKGCGNKNCCVSGGIDDSITFGSGELDDHGYWEKPCWKCAEYHLQAYPKAHVWPYSAEHEEHLKAMPLSKRMWFGGF